LLYKLLSVAGSGYAVPALLARPELSRCGIEKAFVAGKTVPVIRGKEQR
jgi:hypothetical protein